MNDTERRRVSEFKVCFPNYCEGRSDDQILLCLKFIDAGRELIRDKIDKDIEKDGTESLSLIILKLLRKVVGIMESDIRPIAHVESDTQFKDSPSYSHRSQDEFVVAYDTTIEGWSRALDYRDKETEGHSKRVTEMTLSVAREMGMSDESLIHIRRGALLHDIGKLGVPDSILFKPGKLTDDEWKIMKKHPVIAHELLSPIAFLKPSLNIPYCHHEMWDGTGYPRGLKGEQIPIEARIFAVIDFWDALSSDRPYRPAWPQEKVYDYIRSDRRKHFDPDVAEVFLSLKGRVTAPT